MGSYATNHNFPKYYDNWAGGACVLVGVPARSSPRLRGDASLWGVRQEGGKGGEQTALSGEQEAGWEPGEAARNPRDPSKLPHDGARQQSSVAPQGCRPTQAPGQTCPDSACRTALGPAPSPPELRCAPRALMWGRAWDGAARRVGPHAVCSAAPLPPPHQSFQPQNLLGYLGSQAFVFKAFFQLCRMTWPLGHLKQSHGFQRGVIFWTFGTALDFAFGVRDETPNSSLSLALCPPTSPVSRGYWPLLGEGHFHRRPCPPWPQPARTPSLVPCVDGA